MTQSTHYHQTQLLLDTFQQAIQSVYPSKGSQYYSQLCFSSFSTFISSTLLRKKLEKNLIFIFPFEKQSQQIYQELLSYHKILNFPSPLLYLPSLDIIPFTYSIPTSHKKKQRLHTLHSIMNLEEPYCLFTSIDAILYKFPTLKNTHQEYFILTANQEISLMELKKYLLNHDYAKVDIIQNHSEFSIRGSIVDIWPIGVEEPVRLDLFGDFIEKIKFFDPLSQITTDEVKTVVLYPQREVHDLNIFKEKLLDNNQYQRHIKKNTCTQRKKALGENFTLPPFLSQENSTAGLWDVFPMILDSQNLFSIINQHSSFVIWDKIKMDQVLHALIEEKQILYHKKNNRLTATIDELFLSQSYVIENLEKYYCEYFHPININITDVKLSVQEGSIYKGKISKWLEDISQKEKQVFISISNEHQKNRLQHLLTHDLKSQNIHLNWLNIPYTKGFSFQLGDLYTESEIFGKNVYASHIIKNKTQVINHYLDLKIGDYIVHYNYGIGLFSGLKRIKISAYEKDVLELQYADKDKIYLPLEQLQFIHKYIGYSHQPQLDYLGKKSQWNKKKHKAEKEIEKIAEGLLELYAKREEFKGISFSKDTRFQEEFEANFEFEETEDQIRAVNDIKKDMEAEKVMDRLICGDVGYGKTEVAIRAAFKSVMSGYQVCVLCPTTILAFQHYQSFQARFKEFPLYIDMISRLKSTQEKKHIIDKILEGEIDIIIGTHALLSNKIIYKKLGLLIIDEEQKFGVLHKEKIKKIKTNIDTLSMTATPIPRTLQMSLLGIRDLSLIETPPANRIKINTYVSTFNEVTLKDSIEKEIERNGQIYILSNKVKSMDLEATKIKKIVPKVNLRILHGQMDEKMIEEVMLSFYRNEFNTLICSTIIESGIDIPNVNTLIVLDAHNLGLSQLYQIKGRIGRSNRQAYAYFFYPNNRVLTQEATERLNTIQEYNNLGDGFKIALKDLEIRGSGHLLGKEQSGEIMSIGFELYLNMLHEKIRTLKEIKNNEKNMELECQFQISKDFYFPEEYIPDIKQRMEFYKKIISSPSIKHLDKVKLDMEDRFGKIPSKVALIFLWMQIKLLGSYLALEKITYEEEQQLFILTISYQAQKNIAIFIELIKKDRRFNLKKETPKNIYFKPMNITIDLIQTMQEFIGVLDYLYMKLKS